MDLEEMIVVCVWVIIFQNPFNEEDNTRLSKDDCVRVSDSRRTFTSV